MIFIIYAIYLLKHVIERLRRKSRIISTNARNIELIFGDNWRLKLFILLIINLYNHYMNGTDLANQKRLYLITQRKYNVRIWRFLFYWLLDVILINYFILWRLQARWGGINIDWNSIEFNRVLGNALLIYNLKQESDYIITNTAIQTTKIIFKKIALNRCRGVFPKILNRIEIIIDLRLVLLFKDYNICREGFGRNKYINCKINGKASRLERSINMEYVSIINTKYK
jgi:hypothetical protein